MDEPITPEPDRRFAGLALAMESRRFEAETRAAAYGTGMNFRIDPFAGINLDLFHFYEHKKAAEAADLVSEEILESILERQYLAESIIESIRDDDLTDVELNINLARLDDLKEQIEKLTAVMETLGVEEDNNA